MHTNNHHILSIFVLLFSVTTIASPPTAIADDADRPTAIQIGNRRQLFFDDFLIEETTNLTRTWHQAEKHPDNPVLRREFPWEDWRIQLYGTVIFDPAAGIFKAWYMTIPEFPNNKITVEGKIRPGHATLVAYAISKDGVQWEKPPLNQVSFEGSKENNLVGPEMYNPEGFAVLLEPDDADPQRRYKAFYWDHGNGPTIVVGGNEIYGPGPDDGMHVAFSPDGVLWKVCEKRPALDYSSDTGHCVVFDQQEDKYVAFVRSWAKGRTVARTESKDFINWSFPETILATDEQDDAQTQIYGMTVNYYDGIYIGMPWMFHTQDNQFDFQLCHSRDGKTWVRNPKRQVFLPPGPTGAWDSRDMRAACRAVVLEDRVLYYYSGSPIPHATKDPKRLGQEIGLATLRRDGWVSLDAGRNPGTLTTQPFVHPGGTLFINTDASEGEISVEYLDAGGQPLSDVSAAVGIAGDHLRTAVLFGNTTDDLLKGKTIRLRVSMANAKLYSFWYE